MTSALFTPLPIRSITTRNRVWVSPMCQYSCEERDGVVNDWHLVHLGSFARGGAGLVMAEATAVLPEGRITPWCTGIWDDEQRDAWARVTEFIKSQGAVPGIQLQHAGRKASTYRAWSGEGSVPIDDGGWHTVGPSPIPFPGYDPPIALDAQGIADIVAAFGAATRRALDAGFEVIEIHGAHGYLIHQFLSPISNHRTDTWGGSLENRARLLLDVVREVRAVAGEEVPVFVRVSATDWLEPEGLTLKESVTVAGWVREAGGDVMDVSTGGNITGVTVALSDYVTKLLQLLLDVVPALSDVGVIWSPANSGHTFLLRDTEAAARGLKLKVLPVAMASAADVEPALAAIARSLPGALVVLPGPIPTSTGADRAPY